MLKFLFLIPIKPATEAKKLTQKPKYRIIIYRVSKNKHYLLDSSIIINHSQSLNKISHIAKDLEAYECGLLSNTFWDTQFRRALPMIYHYTFIVSI